VLFVQELEKCAAFYRDTLGFKQTFTDDASVAYRVDDYDFVVLKVAAAVDLIGKATLSPKHATGSRMLLCADVDSVDATYKPLKGRGVALIHAPADQPWGIRWATLLILKAMSGKFDSRLPRNGSWQDDTKHSPMISRFTNNFVLASS
jgi:uncharacterized glyoxalase superfamily protein PhnB